MPLAQRQHLRSKDIEKARARLDLEQRLWPRQAHARPQAAVELHDYQPVEHVTGLARWRLGQLIQARQVRKRLQSLAWQEPGPWFTQLLQAPAQGGQLSGMDASGLGLGQDRGDVVGRIHGGRWAPRDHFCRTLRIALADSSDFGMNPATGASSFRSAKSASA